MKKMYTFLLFCFFGVFATAQTFTSTWQSIANTIDANGNVVNTGPYSWFQGNPTMIAPAVALAQVNNTASLDYNPVTNKLLVSCRNNNIYIINAETGVQEGTLSVTGLGSEAFKFNKIRVTSDGVIYGISLATGTFATVPCKIYRWENQLATPTLCASFLVTERTGDAFGLSGTGTNTIIYASGGNMAASPANSMNIYVLTTADGLNFSVNKTINLPTAAAGQWCNRAIDPITNDLNSDLWIKGGGFAARRITVAGTVGTAVTTSATVDGTGNGQISLGFGSLRYFQASNGRKFIAVAGGNNTHAGVKMRMQDVTNEATMFTFGEDSLGLTTALPFYTTNTNGSGDVSFKNHGDGTITVFYLGTNNGIEATRSVNIPLPATLTNFSASLRNKTGIISFTTANESNNKGFEIERSINGKDFAKIAFIPSKSVQGNSVATITYSFDDARVVAGKNYYRLKQLDNDGKFTYSNIVSINLNSNSIFSVKVLANPIGDMLALNVKSASDRTIQINVTNAAGAIVLSKQQTIGAGENNFNLSAVKLPKGILFVTVKDKDSNVQEQAIQIVKD